MMPYNFAEYGLQITKDVSMCCSNCGIEFFLSTEDIERAETYDSGRMGTRINYVFYAECECPRCGNEIYFEQNASEYPERTIEHIDNPRCSGGNVLVCPEIDIPFYDDEIYVSDDPIYSQYPHAEPAILNLPQRLIVDIEDGNACLGRQLYIPNKRTTIWLNSAQRLLPILIEETGTIRFEDNHAVFAEIIQTKPESSAMRLLGKVAEAVIVRNCNDDENLNRIWLSNARRIRTIQRTANDFHAIGTGLHSTKIRYPQKYSPSDPQRDIIWVDRSGNYALSSGGTYTTGGMVAGLQIKVSGNGLNYIRKDLSVQRYEVPLVYFPMNDDFERVLARVNRNSLIVKPGVDFINVRDVDENAYFEVQEFYPLIVDLFTGRLSADRFVREASGFVPLRNGIIATAMSIPKADVRIIH